ncbi:glycosyl transferase, partial [Streptomyces xantholiticus]
PRGQGGQGPMPGGFPGRGEGGGARGAGGGMGGLLGGADVGAAAEAALKQDADAYTWVAAAVGSQNAASYQLATGAPVMAIGGFNGSDPSPTLARFKQYVVDGRIHYFVGGQGAGGGPGGPGGNTSSAVADWVQETFTQVTVGGATLYDLTAEK